MPAAVRDRPPRNGPMARYFMHLKSGSSFLPGAAAFWAGVGGSAGFLSLSDLLCARVMFPANRVSATTSHAILPFVSVRYICFISREEVESPMLMVGGTCGKGIPCISQEPRHTFGRKWSGNGLREKRFLPVVPGRSARSLTSFPRLLHPSHSS